MPNISFIRNRNYLMGALKTTSQLSNEVLRTMAPTTVGVINENAKYLKRKITEVTKGDTYSYKSSKELIEDSINSLKNEPSDNRTEIEQAISKINEFVISNDPIMDYESDDTVTDIKNVDNNSTLFLKTNIKNTLAIIGTLNNQITSNNIDNLSKSYKYLLFLSEFNQDKALQFYNILSDNLKSSSETLNKIKDRINILSKFEDGTFQVNSKYNQIRTVINTIDMFSRDYYSSKLMGNETEEIAMNFITDNVPPIISQIAGIVSYIVPVPIKEALNETESLLKITPVILNNKYKEMMDSDDHLKSAIGSAFYKKIEAEPYEKGVISYDGITRRAVMNAIPSGLAKILNIVSGYGDDQSQEKVFDYSRDTFMTAETILKHATDEAEFNKTRTDTPIYGYKNLVIEKLKEENLYTDSTAKEVEDAMEKISKDKILPMSQFKISENDKLDAIMKNAFKELPPYTKTRFAHYLFNVAKSPQEIISENESYHNAFDIIGLQDIIPKKDYDFKNELSKYLIGKNYNGLAAYLDQKPDNSNPYQPGNPLYYIVEGIRSVNTAISEMLFGVPDGKRSELSIIGEKTLMFVGKNADKAIEAYKLYISSDRRGAKILKDIKDTGIVQTTKDYLKLAWTELKENGIGKWTYDTLINPIANFAKVHVFDKIAAGYTNLVENLKNKASKLDNETPAERVTTKKKITLERAYQIKIKKNIKTVSETIVNDILKPIKNVNEDIKNMSPLLSDSLYDELFGIMGVRYDDKLKEERHENIKMQNEIDRAEAARMKTVSEVFNEMTNPFKVAFLNWFPIRVIRSIYNGYKKAKELRPDIEKRSFMERMKDIISHGKEEKEKRTTTKGHIFKNVATLAYNVVDLKFITPIKTIFTVMKENRKALWSIMKNTISIVTNFYTKFMIPLKIFNLYKNKILGVHVFLETKRFAFAVRRKIVKEALTTIKEAIHVNKQFKKVYQINPEYEKVGFTTKKFNIVGGYLDEIYEKIMIDKYISSYQQTKLHMLNENQDDEQDTNKNEIVVEKNKKTIIGRIKDRLEDINDLLKDTASNVTTKVFGTVGNFAKGVTGTLFHTLFSGSKVGNMVSSTISKAKSIFKGTKTDIDSRIEHVYVIGGQLSGGDVAETLNDLFDSKKSKKIKEDAGEIVYDMASGSGKKGKYGKVILGVIAGGLLLKGIFGKKDKDAKEEENESTESESTISYGNTNEESTTSEETSTSTATPVNNVSKTSDAKPQQIKPVIPTTDVNNEVNMTDNYTPEDVLIVNQETIVSPTVSEATEYKKEPNYGIQRTVKNTDNLDKNIVTASQLQLNSSVFTASLVPISKIKNIDANLSRNYQVDKNYNEQVEKEFVSKLTASEAEEFYANKNAATLAARMRTNGKSIVETLMNEKSLGALAKGGLSYAAAKKLVEEYINQTGLARIKYSTGDKSYGQNSDGSGGGNYGSLPGGGTSIGQGDLFGKVSQKYETSTSDYTGAKKISSGKGDYGGVSYGIPQFSTTMGSAKSFADWLKTTYPQFGNHLAGLSPGTQAFNNGWLAAYNTDPQGFANAQIAYVVKKETIPFISKVYNQLGVNLNANRGLQEMAHSIVLQHGIGGGPKLVKNAGITRSDDPTTIINKLYDERSKVHIYFKSSSSTVQQGVKRRYVDERQQCLALISSPAIDLEALVNGMMGSSVSNAVTSADMDLKNAVTENAINMLNDTLENAVTNNDNIRNIIKNIKSMQLLKDDEEIQQLIEIVSTLSKLSKNVNKMSKDDIKIRYSEEISNDSNKKILKNVFIGGHEGKLA